MTETHYYNQIIIHLENIIHRQRNVITYYNQGPITRLWRCHVNDFSVEVELSLAAEERALIKQLESLRLELIDYSIAYTEVKK